MHTRQSGAAHVPMIFFLLLLILFLGAVVFAWTKANENGQLVKQRDDAVAEANARKQKDSLAKDYTDEIGKVIGKQGKMIRALRLVVNAAAAKQDLRVGLEVAEAPLPE